jgi:hypothetical protein
MDYFQVIKRVPQALLGRQIKSLRTDYILNQNFVILRKPRKKFPSDGSPLFQFPISRERNSDFIL